MSAGLMMTSSVRLKPAQLAGVLALLAALMSWIGLAGRWLWLDELLSANFAAHGPFTTLVTALRFDVHPPLYYLQLSLWMLVGQGDTWLMLNSVLWHAVAVALLALGAARFHGPRIGLAAGLLLAVSPAALAYADQVRMYAFVMALMVAAWLMQTRWLRGESGRFGGLWLVLSQAAVTNSQTAGLLMLSGLVVLGGVTVLLNGGWRRILHWVLLEAAVLALSLPALVIGSMRGVTHLRVPGVEDVVAVWTFLSGGAVLPGPIGLLLGALVLGVLVMGTIRSWRFALEIGMLVGVPLLLAIAASWLVKPVWIERIFVPLIPFLCLGLARALLPESEAMVPAIPARVSNIFKQRGPAALLCLVLAWAGISTVSQLTRDKGDGFRLAAEAIRANTRPGDLVLVDGDFAYWCFLWSLAGPGWGDPRHAVASNPEWDRMLRRLPAGLVRVLDLNQSEARKQIDGVTVMLWDRQSPPPVPETSANVFLLRGQYSAPVDLPARQLATATVLRQISLERWAALPAKPL